MKPLRCIVYIVGTLLFITGCSSKVSTLVYDGKQPLKKGDLLYHLPKTVLMVQVTYTKTEKVFTEHGIERKIPPSYTINKPVIVTTTQVNDPENLYVLRASNGGNVFDIKDVHLALNERGLLTNLQTEQPVPATPVNNQNKVAYTAVYRSSTQAAPATDLDKEDLKKKLSAAYKHLISAIDKGNEQLIKKYKRQIELYNEVIETYNSHNKISVSELDMTYTYYVDPDKMEWANNNLEFTIKANDNSDFPDLTIVLSDVARLNNNTANVLIQNDNGNFNPIDGVLYYLPASVRTMVYVSNEDGNNHIAFDSFMNYPQFGNMGVVPIETGGFARRKTQLQFSPETGTLISYSTGGKNITPQQPLGPIFVPQPNQPLQTNQPASIVPVQAEK
ncbi:hypothetical protein QQ054_26375 [Oscillatoria amoena NRMC-F 0135]|nr:hypothetical protein [Oscillatoria amoena NRMC-F 0135]